RDAPVEPARAAIRPPPAPARRPRPAQRARARRDELHPPAARGRVRDGAPVPTGPDDAVANVRLVDAVFGAAGLRPRGARARSPMEIRRTPDERFVDLPEWPFAPRYVEIEAAPGSAERLRVHYV